MCDYILWNKLEIHIVSDFQKVPGLTEIIPAQGYKSLDPDGCLYQVDVPKTLAAVGVKCKHELRHGRYKVWSVEDHQDFYSSRANSIPRE